VNKGWRLKKKMKGETRKGGVRKRKKTYVDNGFESGLAIFFVLCLLAAALALAFSLILLPCRRVHWSVYKD
jgi:hypothetical protein